MSDPFGYDGDTGLPRKYHQVDLEQEERIFKERCAAFLERIKHANMPSSGGVFGDEKKDELQHVEGTGDKKNVQEKERNVQDSSPSVVESEIADEPDCGDSAISQSSQISPRSPQVNQPSFSPSGEDPLSDIFDNDNQELGAPWEDDAEALLAQAEAEEPEVEEAPAPEPEPVKPAKIDGSIKDAMLTTQADSPKKPDVLKGFDFDGYKSVQVTVERMMSKVTRIDLEHLSDQLDEYEVELDLDSEREIPDIVRNKMIEVQAKLDSVGQILKRLVPYAEAVEEAWDYVKDTGILYAQASSREKRVAQVKLVEKARWQEYAESSRLKKSYENRFKELRQQWETLSRLITADQNRTLYLKNVQRGELPLSETKPSVSGPVRAPEPEVEDKNVFDAKKNEPLDPEKFDHLESMPKKAKDLVSASSKTKKGQVDWGDLDF